MKFGGTSVADAGRIRAACALVAQRSARRPIVVVSALSGVTDALLSGIGRALDGDAAACSALVAELKRRHLETADGLGLSDAAAVPLRAEMGALLDGLGRLYDGIAALGEATPRARDAVAVRGERLSSRLFAAALEASGQPAGWVDAEAVVRTDDDFGHAAPDLDALRAGCSGRVRPVVAEGRVPVLGGFVGATAAGVPTTLGRGGSDYTAALVGVAVGADEVEIWTDVDGIMTADPRLVPAARVLPRVPYDEAAELAYFGAKVLHPATIRPAVEAGIPVRIKNTLNPQAPGTEIRDRVGQPGLTAVAAKRGITLLTVSSPGMLMAHGVLARIFEAFDRHRTPVDLVATSEVSVSMTVDESSRLPAIVAQLGGSFRTESRPGCAIVSLVGRGILSRRGLAAAVFSAVKDINVLMISVGASDINLSFVVSEEDAAAAVRAVHAAFFEEGGA